MWIGCADAVFDADEIQKQPIMRKLRKSFVKLLKKASIQLEIVGPHIK